MPVTPDQSPQDIPPLSPDFARADVAPDVGYVDRGAAVVPSGEADNNRSIQRQRTVWGATALSTDVESGSGALEQEVATTFEAPDSTVSPGETSLVDNGPSGTGAEQNGNGVRESANGNVPLRLGPVDSGVPTLEVNTGSKDTTGSVQAAKTEGGTEDEGGENLETNDPRRPEIADETSTVPKAGDIPTDPPRSSGAEAGFSEPGPGRMLQQIADYGAVAGEEFRAALEERRTIAEGGIEAVALLGDRGVSLDEADDLLHLPHDMDLRDEVAVSQRQHAELQYSEALEATGLRLHSSIQGVEVQMADPARFTAALREVEHPEDATAEENLASQTQAVIDEALDRAGKAIVMQYADEARIICGGTPPMGEAFIEVDEGFRASDEDIALADALPDHADTIAAEFERIEGHEATVEGIEQLALARRDNLVIEWGVGRHIGIIGDKDTLPGVDRLTDESQWDAAYNYLTHLRDTAPRAAFTVNVRDTVIRDIETALSESPMRMELEREIEHGGDYSYDEPDNYGISPQAELEGDSTIPNLRSARDRVRGIFGL